MRRPQNLKKSSTCFDKTVFLLSSVKTSGRFFQIFVAFSEKLNFNNLRGSLSVCVSVMSVCPYTIYYYYCPTSINCPENISWLLDSLEPISISGQWSESYWINPKCKGIKAIETGVILLIGLNRTGLWVSWSDRTGHPNLPNSNFHF